MILDTIETLTFGDCVLSELSFKLLEFLFGGFVAGLYRSPIPLGSFEDGSRCSQTFLSEPS